MHYYKRNLGDYAKKAGRLSMLQHGSYTLLIDACYDRETFPTLEEAVEWTWASTTEEIEAVSFVLRKFFVLEDGVYVQKRIQEELAEYHSKAETNKRIAIERETARAEKRTNRAPVVDALCLSGDEPPPNHKPLTINHKPKEERGAPEVATSPPVGGGLFDEFWKAYPNKVGKDAARKAFDKRKPKRDLLDSMLVALATQRTSKKWTDDGGQYIPHPSTWLNDGRWMDETSAPVAGPADIDSRVAVEREGIAKGVGPWDAIAEQWPAYRERVRAAPRCSGFDLSGLAAMAAKRQGATA